MSASQKDAQGLHNVVDEPTLSATVYTDEFASDSKRGQA
jgi:hypothetical protein